MDYGVSMRGHPGLSHMRGIYFVSKGCERRLLTCSAKR